MYHDELEKMTYSELKKWLYNMLGEAHDAQGLSRNKSELLKRANEDGADLYTVFMDAAENGLKDVRGEGINNVNWADSRVAQILGDKTAAAGYGNPNAGSAYHTVETSPGGLPKYSQAKQDQFIKTSNSLLDILMPQGSDKYNKVARQEEDIETERLARLADKLNNKLYFDPSIALVGDSFGLANKGEIKSAPKMETEDLRQQGLRRENESTRRTWNSGLLQEGKKFEQEMTLALKYRDSINDVLINGLNAESIARETDPGRRADLKDLAKMNQDTRGLLLKIIDSLASPLESIFR
jgi:hypothetical protein